MIEEEWITRSLLILPCEGNAMSTCMIQILGPCTLNVSCNTQVWINTLVCVRPLHVPQSPRMLHARAQSSARNIYTSIHSRLVEGWRPWTDVAFCPLNRSTVFVRVRMKDLPDLRIRSHVSFAIRSGPNSTERTRSVRMFREINSNVPSQIRRFLRSGLKQTWSCGGGPLTFVATLDI